MLKTTPQNLGKTLDNVLRDHKELTLEKSNIAIKKAVIRTWGNIIKDTPVDQGRARGAWLIGFSVTLSQGRKSSSKNAGYIAKGLPKDIFKTPFFLFNNLPYIETLEFGGYPNPPKKGKGLTVNGFSKKAPKGMVRLNLLRWGFNLRVEFKKVAL